MGFEPSPAEARQDGRSCREAPSELQRMQQQQQQLAVSLCAPASGACLSAAAALAREAQCAESAPDQAKATANALCRRPSEALAAICKPN